MAFELFLETLPAYPVVEIRDLGIQIVHTGAILNVLDDDTGLAIKLHELVESNDFQDAITTGKFILRDGDNNVVTDLSLLSTDEKVKLSATDSVPGFLLDKLALNTSKVTGTLTGSGANEVITLTLPPNIIDNAVHTLENLGDGASRKAVSADQKNALDAASGPTGANPILTVSDAATSLFNANKIDGISVTTTGIAPGNILAFNNSTNTFEPTAFNPTAAGGWVSGAGVVHLQNSSDSVGIGTNTPTEKFHVVGNALVTGLVNGRDIAVDGSALDSHIANLSNPHAVTKEQVGLANVDNVQQIPLSEKGQPGGVATLDLSGKVPVSQIPDIPGAFEIKGNWDAAANSPTFADGGVGGDAGDIYIVTVAGNTTIDGYTDWQAGDWVVNAGSIWVKQDNTERVTSVAGKIGDVILASTDITDFTPAVAATPSVSANTAHRNTLSGNPHNVTATEVGKDVSQWNADRLRGVAINPALAPANLEVLQYNATNSRYESVNPITKFARLNVDTVVAGRSGKQRSGYLRGPTGSTMNVAPYVVPWGAKLTLLTITHDSSNNDFQIQVRVDGGAGSVLTANISAANRITILAADFNLTAGQTVEVYLEKGTNGSGGGSNISDPKVKLYFERLAT